MMGRNVLVPVHSGLKGRRAKLMIVCLVSLGPMLASEQARADVPPPEEDACDGAHRAGDPCFTDNWELHPKRLDGTCQISSCFRVDGDRWKGEPAGQRPTKTVPCLKCVPNQVRTENGSARGATKSASHTKGPTDAGNSCSLARSGSAARRITLWLVAGAIPTLFLAVRRRRS